MSADADRIAFTCPECRRTYGKTGRTKWGMATCCEEQSVRLIAEMSSKLVERDEWTRRLVEERVAAEAATATERTGHERTKSELAEAREETRRYAQVADSEKRDRVEMRRLLDEERAVLERTKSELAEARKQFETEREEMRNSTWITTANMRADHCAAVERERAAHERTKAELVHTREQLRLADADATKLNALRAERNAVKVELEKMEARAQSAWAEVREVIESLKIAHRERDAASAEAVAMRGTIETIHAGLNERNWIYDACERALSRKESRALAARVPLLEAVVDAARNYRVPHRSGYGREDSGKMLDDALAALDAQEPK